MSNKKLLFKGSLLRTIVLAANILTGFFLMPFLINSLGNEQYGLWILASTIVGFYGLLDVGLGGACTRFIVRSIHDPDPDSVNYAISTGVFLFLLLSGITVILTFILYFTGEFFVSEKELISIYSTLIFLLGIKSAISFPLVTFHGVLMAKERFDYISYVQLIMIVCRVSFIYYFISNGHNVITLAYIVIITDILSNILIMLTAIKIHPTIRVGLRFFSFKKLKSYYNWGKYTYLSVIAQRLNHSTDDVVIASIVGVGAVTHYTIATTLINYFNELIVSAFGVILPKLNKYHKLKQFKEIRQTIFNALDLSSQLSLFIGGMFIIMGQAFLNIWVGTEFTDSYYALVILSIPVIFSNMQTTTSSALFATAQHQTYTKVILLSAIINLSLSVLLCYKFGLIGAAFGTAVPMLLFYIVFLPVHACKKLEIKLSQYYIFIIKRVIFSILFFVITYWIINPIVINNYFTLILGSAIITILYFILAYLLILTPVTKSHIQQTLNRTR